MNYQKEVGATSHNISLFVLITLGNPINDYVVLTNSEYEIDHINIIDGNLSTCVEFDGRNRDLMLEIPDNIERLTSFVVYQDASTSISRELIAWDGNDTNTDLCSGVQSQFLSPSGKIYCNEIDGVVHGKFVRVLIPERTNLTICEIKLYGVGRCMFYRFKLNGN